MTPLAKKLLIKPGAVVHLVGAPPEAAALLDPLPEGAVILSDGGRADDARPAVDRPADVVLAFVRHADDLARLGPVALDRVRRDGVLWIAYLKGGAKAGTDLNRDILHGAFEAAHGWTGVSLVAVDARWSAMRFRPRAAAPPLGGDLRRAVLAAAVLSAVAMPARASALALRDSTRDSANTRAPRALGAAPPDTAPLVRLEVWGGVSPGSSRWGVLGATPHVRLALAAVRVSRRLTDATGPAATRAWWYTFDLIPLGLVSPPYVSTPGAPGCARVPVCAAPRAPNAHAVYLAGASPLGLTYVWRATQPVQLSLGSTGGFLWSTQPVPTTRAARFNYTATLDAGVRFASATGPELALVYRYHHLSDANTAAENPAIASHVLSASVGWHRARARARQPA